MTIPTQPGTDRASESSKATFDGVEITVFLPRKVYEFFLESHPDIHGRGDLAQLMREMMEEVYRIGAEEPPR